MPINQIPSVRGGETYHNTIGINAEMENNVFLEPQTLDGHYGMQERINPAEMTIKFDTTNANGKVISIHTVWNKQVMAANGMPILETVVQQHMLTNEVDIRNFVAMFGGPIMMSMLNGYYREILGYNDKPLFDSATGKVKTYTAEQEAELPTFDYHTPVAPAIPTIPVPPVE